MSDLLYGEYQWRFRLAGIVLLAISFSIHLHITPNIRKESLMPLTGTVFSFGVIAYITWLYVIVELMGIALGIWEI